MLIISCKIAASTQPITKHIAPVVRLFLNLEAGLGQLVGQNDPPRDFTRIPFESEASRLFQV